MPMDPNHPDRDTDESLLDHATPERQDMDDLVADGMDDEANVTPEEDGVAEEEAVRPGRPLPLERE
jgi:hypothetical protein